MKPITPEELRKWSRDRTYPTWTPVPKEKLAQLAQQLEDAQEAYLNMREWAEKNGVDTATYGTS